MQIFFQQQTLKYYPIQGRVYLQMQNHGCRRTTDMEDEMENHTRIFDCLEGRPLTPTAVQRSTVVPICGVWILLALYFQVSIREIHPSGQLETDQMRAIYNVYSWCVLLNVLHNIQKMMSTGALNEREATYSANFIFYWKYYLFLYYLDAVVGGGKQSFGSLKLWSPS